MEFDQLQQRFTAREQDDVDSEDKDDEGNTDDAERGMVYQVRHLIYYLPKRTVYGIIPQLKKLISIFMPSWFPSEER